MMDGEVRVGAVVRRRQTWFRKPLIIPAEHGTWSWLLVPYFVGLGVAREFNLPAALVLVGGLAAFLARQPATAWMRARSGRGRKADGPAAAGWTVSLMATALLCLAGLIALGRSTILWLLGPMALLFLLYLAAARRRRADTRALPMELAGAAGLALMAPAAHMAATGDLVRLAWALWGLMAGQNVLGALYVRLRIADTRRRPMSRMPVLWGHVIGAGAAAAAALVGTVRGEPTLPWLAATPFAAFLLRALWAVARPRPVAGIRRFGFSEVGVEALAGAVVIAGYWLS